MESLSLWTHFREFFGDTELVIPASQMVIYVIIINLLMLASFYKACFLVSLAFSYYWLFFLNQSLFVDSPRVLYVYCGGGVFFLVFAMLSFLKNDK